MHGTLEVKQDALTADAVKKPEWMEEISAEDMTEEQRKVGKQTHKSSTDACVTVPVEAFLRRPPQMVDRRPPRVPRLMSVPARKEDERLNKSFTF